jgi:hypothetical protein
MKGTQANHDPFRDLPIWHRLPLRFPWLFCRRAPLGAHKNLLAAAFSSVPHLYRWLGFSVPIKHLHNQILPPEQTQRINAELKQGAKVWPFTFSEHRLCMRQGYVLVRAGLPREVVLTLVA